MGAFEDGNTFLAGVLAKLPESVRGQVKEVLEKPEAKDAVTLIGDGVLARSDYSKHMDALKTKETELTTKYEDLNTWYEANKNALAEYPTLKTEVERLKKGGGGEPPPAPKPGEEPPDPRAVALEVVNDAGRDYVQISAWLAGKAVQHSQMFGESLDTMELVNNPKLGKPIAGQPGRVFSLEDAYREKHGERVVAKTQEAENQRIEGEVKKRLDEERKKLVGQPFPLRGGDSPSVLDTLTQKDGTAAHTLDTAVAEYDRLVGARGTT
jgi:hypothetical protein